MLETESVCSPRAHCSSTLSRCAFLSLAVVLALHVGGNIYAAQLLLPEGENAPSFDRITATPMRSARAIIMSPVLEEMIFRGLVSCVIYNRCRDPKPGSDRQPYALPSCSLGVVCVRLSSG